MIKYKKKMQRQSSEFMHRDYLLMFTAVSKERTAPIFMY
jgi:hypothetical protein